MKLSRFLFGAGILISINSSAATYYVSTIGSNGNPGTSTRPFRNIAYAVRMMNQGDTTFVRSGTYRESMILFRKSGTRTAPIKLLNEPGHFPVIDFSNAPESTFPRILIQHALGANNAIGWITIEGFEIKNGHDGIKYHNLHDSTIRRNWIHHNGQGILGQGGLRVLIDRNKFNHNGPFEDCLAGIREQCAHDHGIYAYGSLYTITNNLFYDNIGFGIQVNGSSSSNFRSIKNPAPEYAGASNWVIANNTFAYQKNAAGIVLWGANCINTLIVNNIFYENSVSQVNSGTQGIHFLSMATTNRGIQINNNLVYASGAGGTRFLGPAATEGVHYTQSGNIVNTANPRFVNAPAIMPTSPNFALTSLSPAINRGLTNSLARFDVIGISRPQGGAFDIGAYEFVSGLLPRPPSGITILSGN